MYALTLSPRAVKRAKETKFIFEAGAALLAAWAFSTVADYVSYLWDAESWLTNRIFEIGQEMHSVYGESAYSYEELAKEKAALEAQLAEVQRARQEAEQSA